MSKVIFTPWKTHSDLLAVRSQFYPAPEYTGPDLRSQACATVGAWKLRGNLPHPVEATALLTDAILHDDASKNSIFAIRATYAAAFCRFVTGLVDSKLGARKSMFSRALDLGLPASFVELRHEATHRELPSLTVLRDSAGRSLEWLWGFYWRGVGGAEPGSPAFDGDGDDAGRVREVVDGLLEQAEALVNGEPSRKKRRVQQDQAAVATRVVSVLKGETGAAAVAARVMLREGVLVPTGRGLGDSLTEVIGKWDPLLQMITEGHPSFLVTLVETMVDELAFSGSSGTKSDPYCDGVYTWLDHVLHSAQWELQRQFMSYSYIRAVCEGSSNHWTALLKKSIGGEDSLPTIAQLDRQTSAGGNPDLPDIDDDLKTLSKFGWGTADTWDSRALGVVQI
ncbi:Las1-like-domain-containing protein [Aspergillus varians]